MSSGLVTPFGRPVSSQKLSGRKARAAVGGHHQALRTLTQALSTFLQLGFFGRLGWLLFGARIFGPRPNRKRTPTLEDVVNEARERQAGQDDRAEIVR